MLAPRLANTVYQNLVKPNLFLLDPELVHDTFTKVGILLGSTTLTKKITSILLSYQHQSLQKSIDGIAFSNPVGLSAGFDYNGELTDVLPSVGFGWQSIGTITLEQYAGNKRPRLGRFPNSKALLVNKGLKNQGAQKIIERLEKKHFTIPIGISIASTNKHFNSIKDQLLDVAQCFRLFEKSKVGHSYYELNISCPNTFGGEPFTIPTRLELLLSTIDALNLSKPMYIKMPIDQSAKETLALLEVANNHNVQGLIMGNLTKDYSNPAVNIDDAKKWKTKQGNLSGKPTWERSNNLISLTKKNYGKRFTIIGTGGIFSGKDAQHKIDLGADLVQLITGMVYQGPQLIGQINKTLASNTLEN